MRIAILTLPLHTNYGGILQAYALQTVLERMGHKVEVLDKRRREKTNLPLDVKIKRFILKYVLLKKINPLREDIIYKRRKIENKHTWKFADKYIHRREISSFHEIKEGDYDAIIVGSDQVWRPHYFKNHYESISDAFLAFAQNWKIKRVAYAPSFGTNIWEYSDEDTKECAHLLKKFNYISIREISGIELCKKYFNINALHVLDPTLLLKKDDYIKLFKCQKTQKRTGILCYFLDISNDKKALLTKLEKELKLNSFTVNTRIEDCSYDIIDTQPPVEEWLKGFYDCDYVVTDSFHACIFSIIFNKPFIVYKNEKRGTTRIKSLLESLNLDAIHHNNNTIKPSILTTKKIDLYNKNSIHLLNKILQS